MAYVKKERFQKSYHFAETLPPEEQLAVAVINRALQDYRLALRKEARLRDNSSESRTLTASSDALVKWFHGRWASVLMQGADPEELLSKAKAMARN